MKATVRRLGRKQGSRPQGCVVLTAEETMSNTEEITEEIRRLRWRCRRGLLELDVILEHFLDQHYRQLSDSDKATFVRLLTCADPDLLSWLVNGEIPTDEELRKIVVKIATDR